MSKFTTKYYWVNDKIEKWLLVRQLSDEILPNGCIRVEVVGKVPTRILEVATTHCETASEFYESGTDYFTHLFTLLFTYLLTSRYYSRGFSVVTRCQPAIYTVLYEK